MSDTAGSNEARQKSLIMMPGVERFPLVGKIGARLGILGAGLLALNNSYSPFGYLFFLASSVSLVCWGKANGFRHQIEMQFVFTLVNMIGLYNWVIKPLAGT